MKLLTSTMSSMTPIISPALMALPYLGPLELLLCLSSPLYMAQPSAVSEKAYTDIILIIRIQIELVKLLLLLRRERE